MFKQMSKYFEPFFSKFQSGFRKRFSAQQCLLSMLEKQKSAVDNQKRFVVLLADLSKGFDCLSHDRLFAKLNAYGFSINSLRLVQDYLTNCKQRTRIKFSIQLMGRNSIRSSPGISFRASFVQHLFMFFFFFPLWMTLILQVIQMITNCKICQKYFFNGLWITK